MITQVENAFVIVFGWLSDVFNGLQSQTHTRVDETWQEHAYTMIWKKIYLFHERFHTSHPTLIPQWEPQQVMDLPNL